VIPWITYVDAITEALRVEMRRDSTVLCMAGASANGTTPRRTDELLREFGQSRVTEHDGAPSMLAAAAAAASEGMRPVCELDLGHLGEGDAGQLADAASSGALVLRLVSNGDAAGSAPGWRELLPRESRLKVVSPATAADAKGLLISAIRDTDAVCFVESRDLYHVRDGVPEGSHTVPLGKARLARQGTDVVVLAHGAAAAAAQRVANSMHGAVGVVDLRSLRPLDCDTVTFTARETGKILIAEQPGAATGLAPELAELIDEQASEYLDAPIREIGTGPEAGGERAESLEEACRELVAF
jgi:pyruvate/2-oxoglutarate/acetoin dehydrogenase E1 component